MWFCVWKQLMAEVKLSFIHAVFLQSDLFRLHGATLFESCYFHITVF